MRSSLRLPAKEWDEGKTQEVSVNKSFLALIPVSTISPAKFNQGTMLLYILESALSLP